MPLMVHVRLYPPINEIVEQCEKFRLLERLLERLFARKHKVLIFSQWTKVLDILDYYLSEKGFEVCRIDGSVKLDERKRQRHLKNEKAIATMIEDALEVATDLDYRFELAIQLGRLEVAKLILVG
ncbi:ATP-dependent DNA helicase [Arachis hypogaea]|nr:ATP-dependent DNA helicase [Arachis hypogaea]